MTSPDPADRYHRQRLVAELGDAGQRRLERSTALLVGVGGLGSWAAELLARAGVGRLRLVDPDVVTLSNIHRQAGYDEADARAARAKVDATARRLGRVNPNVPVEAVRAPLTSENALELAEGADVILDGTDVLAARYLINDVAVERKLPWVFTGIVRAEAQTLTIVPGRTPCLRCLFADPPPAESLPDSTRVGVLGPAVAAISSIAVIEAVKILAGRLDRIRPTLWKVDWLANRTQEIDLSAARDPDCPCCVRGRRDFLRPETPPGE